MCWKGRSDEAEGRAACPDSSDDKAVEDLLCAGCVCLLLSCLFLFVAASSCARPDSTNPSPLGGRPGDEWQLDEWFPPQAVCCCACLMVLFIVCLLDYLCLLCLFCFVCWCWCVMLLDVGIGRWRNGWEPNPEDDDKAVPGRVCVSWIAWFWFLSLIAWFVPSLLHSSVYYNGLLLGVETGLRGVGLLMWYWLCFGMVFLHKK